MTTSFSDKMRQRFAQRAAERAAEAAAKAPPAEPAAQGSVAGKVPVSGPPPRRKAAKAAAPAELPKAKPLGPVAARRVLNRASEAGYFAPQLAAYKEATVAIRRSKKKSDVEVRRKHARSYFDEVLAAAAALVDLPAALLSASTVVKWSKTNQRPTFRRVGAKKR